MFHAYNSVHKARDAYYCALCMRHCSVQLPGSYNINSLAHVCWLSANTSTLVGIGMADERSLL
jgi:hypothetical protein